MMGIILVVVGVIVVVLVIGKIGDWVDDKTGWVIGAIVAGAIGTLLISGTVQAHRESIQPRPQPVCKLAHTC